MRLKSIFSILAFTLTVYILFSRAAYAETDINMIDPSSTCYEIFVYSFFDSGNDGIGDLQGVIQKLDYVCGPGEGSLGCDMIWLMPVFSSPTYHKYDVMDYLQIDPEYGTLQDMEELIQACHSRGVRLILDLPLNHTSTDHPWFIQAAEYLKGLDPEGESDSAKCPYIDYYNFSREQQDGYVPLDGTTWYYEARFWEGMPDLNLDSEAVRYEISQITAFWQESGIDGFRLDAVTSYYTDSKEKSIEFVRWLTELVREKDPDSYLVGEAWKDMDTYLQYYSSGIDSMFDFAFAGPEGVIASVTRGSKPAEWYGQQLVWEEEQRSLYSDTAINAPFYTNHDMARSAGYYPKDGGARTKFAWALNLLSPGNAFIYYGEELGMNGSGKDENKRAPMRWSGIDEGDVYDGETNSSGMCIGPPDMDQISMSYPALDGQLSDPASIFSCVRDVIRLRKKYPVIASGRTQLIEEMSGKDICTLVRTCSGLESVMIIMNASEKEQQLQIRIPEKDSVSASFSDIPDTLTLTPYAIALIGEEDEEWTLINDNCVLPIKRRTGRR